MVLGLSAGTAVITYTTASGCYTTAVVTVNAVPAPITGAPVICAGSVTTLSTTTTGGTWSTSDAFVATIDATTGILSGASAGTVTVSYTNALGCVATAVITVQPLPVSITGSTLICVGTSSSLSSATPGGLWSSSDVATATVNAIGVVDGIAAGTATITYTLGSGCYTTTIVTIDATAPAISGTLAICPGGVTTLTNPSAGGTWVSSSPVASIGVSSGVATGIVAGTVVISYTTTSGCITTAVLTVNPAPAGIAGTLRACEGLTSTLSNSTSGGAWTSSDITVATVNASGVVSAAIAGTTNITYTLPTGCLTSSTFTVDANPAAITGTLAVCQSSSTTLASATTGGIWGSSAPATAIIDVMTGVATGVSAGTAGITYTSALGCTTAAVLTVNPLPSVLSGTLSLCAGSTTTLASVTPGGTWVSGNATVATVTPAGVASGTVSGGTPGTATITYTLGTGCYTTATVTVQALPSPVTGTLTVCATATTTLSTLTTGGNWSSSATGTATITGAGVVTGIAAGTAVITYTTGTGCIATAVVTVQAVPSAITGSLAVCQGLTATLASLPGGGTWTSSNANATIDASLGVATAVTPGTTTISYTLSTGCAATAVLTVQSLPAAITGVTTVCQASTTTLSNTTTGGTWTSGNTLVATVNTSGVVTGIAAGTAGITYATAAGCSVSTIVTVNALPAPVTGTASVCQGLTTTLSSTTTGGTWASSNANATIGSSSGIVTGVNAGTSVITYTIPSTGCHVTAVVTVNTTPGAITGALAVCRLSTTTLGATPTGGTWTSGNTSVATIGNTTGVVSGVAAGTSRITYTTVAGCTTTAIVTVNPLPSAITGTTSVCAGLTTTLADITTGGTWTSGSANATIGSASGIVQGVTAGTANITYALTLTGCRVTTVVTVNPLPGAIGGPTAVCQASTITLTNTGGGTWTSNTTSVATIGPSSGIVTGVTAGTTVITYTLSTGCTATRVISVNPLPSGITGSSAVCAGSQITLSNISAGTWASSSANATIGASTGIVTGVTAGNATITFTLSTGCYTTTPVTVNPLPSAIGGTGTVCIGSTATLTNTGGGTWQADNTNINIGTSSGIVDGITVGTSTVTYTLPTGCAITRVVSVNPLPSATTGTFVLCAAATTTLSNTGGGTWSSSSATAAVGAATGIVTGVTAGTADITYTLSTGCYVTSTVTVNALPVAYAVTGGGSYCVGSTGLHVGVANSETGIDYQLYTGSSATGTPLAGSTGIALDFGIFTTAGTYTVMATNTTTGCSASMGGSAVITINPLMTPAVSITLPTTLCSGSIASFNAVPVNGGTAPVYQWQVNGSVVGTTAANYTYTPANGDVLSVKLTSNMTCATPDTAIATDTLTVLTTGLPSVSVTTSTGTSICAGTFVGFTAVPVLGGGGATYRWNVNGVLGGTAPVFTYAPANGDVVTCTLYSTHACRLADSAVSAPTVMSVAPVVIPVVSINVTPGVSVAPGTLITFNAIVTGAGTGPAFQWYVNGSPVAGATTAVYSSSTVPDNATVKCVVMGGGPCGQQSFSSVTIKYSRTGVDNTTRLTYLQAIPNPNTGTFAVSGAWAADEVVTLDVVNVTGQSVYSTTVTPRNGDLAATITLPADVASGIYMLSARSAGHRATLRIIVGK